jgi:hypothetical protein
MTGTWGDVLRARIPGSRARRTSSSRQNFSASMGSLPSINRMNTQHRPGLFSSVFGQCVQSDEIVRRMRALDLLRATARESLYVVHMTVGWRFIGEVWGLSKRPIVLECVVPIADRKQAEAIAKQRLAGADSITAIELLKPDKGAAPH